MSPVSSANQHKMELLWERLEQAKVELDLAHNRVKEINQEKLSGAIPYPDGDYAHGKALRSEELAIGNYLRALRDFRFVLNGDEARSLSDDAALDPGSGKTHPGCDSITPRERQVLMLIASGKSSKQLAAELGIALSTAVCHRYRLQTKLNAHNTADLTRAALRMGLLKL